jgi:integrase
MGALAPTPVHSFSRAVHRIVLARAGLDIQAYDLRHTFGSNLSTVIDGTTGRPWSIARCAEYMGHTPDVYTAVYLHARPDEVANNASDLAAAFA